ncbi:MAG: HxlR family transcriptional regulator [Bacillaceae bacterium G1]|nr:transcriptional regulator [Bacillota bacterium]OJF18128.1 MAG: HxlR family transcriptional regulator [Bacillaceae bacterium G1]
MKGERKENRVKAVEKETTCPIERTLNVIGGKWVILIIRELIQGKKRFSELENELGASSKMISLRLKELEKNGIVRRTVIPDVPPKVEYTLTEKGESLNKVLDAMAEWGRKYGSDETTS